MERTHIPSLISWQHSVNWCCSSMSVSRFVCSQSWIHLACQHHGDFNRLVSYWSNWCCSSMSGSSYVSSQSYPSCLSKLWGSQPFSEFLKWLKRFLFQSLCIPTSFSRVYSSVDVFIIDDSMSWKLPVSALDAGKQAVEAFLASWPCLWASLQVMHLQAGQSTDCFFYSFGDPISLFKEYLRLHKLCECVKCSRLISPKIIRAISSEYVLIQDQM